MSNVNQDWEQIQKEITEQVKAEVIEEIEKERQEREKQANDPFNKVLNKYK